MLDRLKGSPWLWSMVVAVACLANGPALFEAFGLEREMVPDFYQEYASARNFGFHIPIYSKLPATIGRDTSTRWADNSLFCDVNAHPPSTVLLALPFSLLGFERAFLAWNVASLVGLVVALRIVHKNSPAGFPSWCWAPLLILFLTSNPLRQQIRQGQLNLILLPLLTMSWAGLRSGRPAMSGCLLGLAAAIKLYPAYLIAYYAWQRRRDIVIPAVGTFMAITGLTVMVLGVETYRTYIFEVIPEVGWFRIGWNNASILGFWSRLFDPFSKTHRWYWFTEPLWRSPSLAMLATLTSDAAITIALARATRRKRQGQGEGLGFALAVTAMLLITPVAWEHSMILLLVPFTETLSIPSRSWRDDLRLGVFAMIFWVDPTKIWGHFIRFDEIASPVHSLLLFSMQFYALIGIFLFLLRENRTAAPSLISGVLEARSPGRDHFPATPIEDRHDRDGDPN